MPVGQELRAAGSLRVCVCLCASVCVCVLHASLAAHSGRDANPISDAGLCVQCAGRAVCVCCLRDSPVNQTGNSPSVSPAGRATSSAVTAGVRRSPQRERSPAPEPGGTRAAAGNPAGMEGAGQGRREWSQWQCGEATKAKAQAAGGTKHTGAGVNRERRDQKGGDG